MKSHINDTFVSLSITWYHSIRIKHCEDYLRIIIHWVCWDYWEIQRLIRRGYNIQVHINEVSTVDILELTFSSVLCRDSRIAQLVSCTVLIGAKQSSIAKSKIIYSVYITPCHECNPVGAVHYQRAEILRVEVKDHISRHCDNERH